MRFSYTLELLRKALLAGGSPGMGPGNVGSVVPEEGSEAEHNNDMQLTSVFYGQISAKARAR